MKVKIKLYQIGMYPEEELIFEIIPNTGDGVSLKNNWFLRVSKDLISIDDKGKIDLSDEGILFRAKRLIGEVTGIEDDSK